MFKLCVTSTCPTATGQLACKLHGRRISIYAVATVDMTFKPTPLRATYPVGAATKLLANGKL